MGRHEQMLGRCDRCGAEAKQRVTKDEFELLFCNHHFDEVADVLISTGWSTTSQLAPV